MRATARAAGRGTRRLRTRFYDCRVLCLRLNITRQVRHHLHGCIYILYNPLCG